MSGIADLTMQTAQYALDGLDARATTRANNIANAETPGFTATGVNFETALANALREGTTPGSSGVTTYAEGGAINAQDNDVSLETEMTGQVKDSLTYQAMVNGFNYKVTILKDAIGSQNG